MRIKDYISGDLFLWALIAVLCMFSFIPVYSASTNLAYLHGGAGETMSYLLKHTVHIIAGVFIIWLVHKTPYHYFKAFSVLLLPVAIILLFVTAFQGTTMDGANASRWLQIPGTGMSFQPSTFAGVVLLTYVAKYLAGNKDKEIDFKRSLLFLWLPVVVTLMFVLPSNFSTTALIFVMVLMVCFIGGYPLKYLGIILGSGLIALTLFILVAKAAPDLFPNRVDTWISRVEAFSGDGDSDTTYQTDKAKTAIATGYIYGLGPGKSQQKYFLPQSSSDFIYAIIIEEFGLVGGFTIILVYLLVLFRMAIIAFKSDTLFGTLMIVGVGFPIIFQALINMAVAVNILPVTGQTLPFVSSGGTSIWMTALAIGMVLSVSVKRTIIKSQMLDEDEANPLDILSEAL